jgi:competence protein ComGC
MALAGHCEECSEDVWLAPDGSCPQGHSAQYISRVWDAAPAPPVAPQAPTPGSRPFAPTPGYVPMPTFTPEPPRKGNAGLAIAFVVLGLLGMLFLCGIMAVLSIPMIGQMAQTDVLQKACFANERAVDGASQTYAAVERAMPGSQQELVRKGYLPSERKCPAGGTYTYDPKTGRITCSIHGSYETHEP